jgi:hypothetical protein
MIRPHPIDFGAVQFMPLDYFKELTRASEDHFSIDPTAQPRLLDTVPGVESIGDWPRVHTAFCRDGVFVVEASTPDFNATLRFFPECPQTGEYEIHNRENHRVERGRTITVRIVPSTETDPLVSMLVPFANRYAVVTTSAERPHRRLIWLVGLKAFRTLDGAGAPPSKTVPHFAKLRRRLFSFEGILR